MKDIVKIVLVLVIIAVLSGLILGFVNYNTQVNPDEQLKAKLVLVYDDPSNLTTMDLSTAIAINDPDISAYGSILNVFTAADGTYVILALGKGGYGGDVQLLYAIKDKKIIKMAKYSHSETPGLGSVGFEESYLSTYYNKDISSIDKFTIVKTAPVSDSEIKAITSATYTSGAIANATNVAAYWYNINGPYAVPQLTTDQLLLNKISEIYTDTTLLSSADLADYTDLNVPAYSAYGSVLNVFISTDGTYIIRTMGKGGYADGVELIYSIKENIILDMVTYRSSETPGKTPFLATGTYFEKYIGKDISDIDEFTVIKTVPAIDSQIQAYTGATRTSEAIGNATNMAIFWYKVNGPYASV